MTAAYAAGATTRQLAAEFGIHRVTIARHLHKRGIPTADRISDTEIARAIQLYADGWSLARIGELLGRDPTSIANILKRAGIPRRDTHGRARS